MQGYKQQSVVFEPKSKTKQRCMATLDNPSDLCYNNPHFIQKSKREREKGLEND